jgi:hypothetical protein
MIGRSLNIDPPPEDAAKASSSARPPLPPDFTTNAAGFERHPPSPRDDPQHYHHQPQQLQPPYKLQPAFVPSSESHPFTFPSASSSSSFASSSSRRQPLSSQPTMDSSSSSSSSYTSDPYPPTPYTFSLAPPSSSLPFQPVQPSHLSYGPSYPPPDADDDEDHQPNGSTSSSYPSLRGTHRLAPNEQPSHLRLAPMTSNTRGASPSFNAHDVDDSPHISTYASSSTSTLPARIAPAGRGKRSTSNNSSASALAAGPAKAKPPPSAPMTLEFREVDGVQMVVGKGGRLFDPNPAPGVGGSGDAAAFECCFCDKGMSNSFLSPSP